MSANNFLFLKKSGDKYTLEERDFDCDYHCPIHETEDLYEIIAIAKGMMDEQDVEGGLRIHESVTQDPHETVI
jgi:hypothetical protein